LCQCSSITTITAKPCLALNPSIVFTRSKDTNFLLGFSVFLVFLGGILSLLSCTVCYNDFVLSVKDFYSDWFSSHLRNPCPFHFSGICELYMAVHAIEWQISQCLLQLNWDQFMERYIKGLRDLHEYLHEIYFHSVVWPSYLCSRVNSYTSF